MIDRPRWIETPALFGRDASLVGLTCRPTVPRTPDKPFVIFLNAGIVHRTGPHRTTVHLARALADAGVPSLRFDLSGIGDSVVPSDAPAMSIQERVRIDIDDAIAFAHTHGGATSFILSGLCSGADNALRTAARRDDVVGLALLDLNVPPTRGYYLRHYGRRLLRGETWRNVLTGRHPAARALLQRLHLAAADARTGRTAEDASLPHDAVVPYDEMRQKLTRLLARDARLLCVFSAGRESHYNYERQFADLFKGLEFGDRVRSPFFADADHTFTGPALQARLCRTVVDWVSETAFPGADAPSPRAVPALDPPSAAPPRPRPTRPGMQPASGSSGIERGR